MEQYGLSLTLFGIIVIDATNKFERPIFGKTFISEFFSYLFFKKIIFARLIK